MTNSEDKHKWYVVRAITGQEKKVKHNVQVELERDNKLSYVPEILIPTEKVYQVKDGKKVIKERNAFPGYILVRADFSDPEVMPLIKSVSGVVGFLGSKNQEGCSRTKKKEGCDEEGCLAWQGSFCQEGTFFR